MIESTIFLALFYSITCGVLVVAHSMWVGRVTLIDWALLAIGGMYGLGWPLVLYVTLAGDNPVWAPWILPFENMYLIHNIAAFFLLFGLLVGWYLMAPLCNWFYKGRAKTSRFQTDRWLFIFWFLLFFAIMTQFFYSIAYGGLLGQLDYSAAIRSSRFDVVPNNPFSFLKPFGGLAMVSAYGFFGLCLSERRELFVYTGFLLSFCFSLFVLYSWMGRVGFLVFVVTFPLGIALLRIRSPLRLLLGGVTLFLIILIGVYFVSVVLNIKSADSLWSFLGRELAFPFGSFFAQLDYGEHLFRGFYDLAFSPIYTMPSSWWSEWIVPVGQINTTVIIGAPKGEAGVTGAIPVDLLTLGLMQMHLFGVVIVGLLFGMLLRVLNSMLEIVSDVGVRAVFEANIALTIAVLGVFYSQPNHVVAGNIHWIAAVIIFLLVIRLPRFRVRSNISEKYQGPTN